MAPREHIRLDYECRSECCLCVLSSSSYRSSSAGWSSFSYTGVHTVPSISVLAAGEFILFDIVCKQRIIVPITELLAAHFKHQGSDLCMYTAMDLSVGIAARARHALAVLLTAAVLFNTAAHSGVNAARARAFGMSACVDEHVAATPCVRYGGWRRVNLHSKPVLLQ